MAALIGLWRNLNRFYESVFEKQDPRVASWPLMQNQVPTVAIVATYLSFVKYLGPKWMKHRKPFDLRWLMVLYNLVVALINGYIFVQIGRLGWFRKYNFKCQPVDYSDAPEAMQMAEVSWLFWIMKFIELADTVFFVLRKKFEHVSKLHVIHHGLVPITIWFGIKFAPGGYITFCGFLNSFVHLVMYTYYGLAALGPGVRRFLWWKKYLTTLQMVQFIFLGGYYTQLWFRDCEGVYRPLLLLNISHGILFFFMFSDYYKKAYHSFRTKDIKNKNQNQFCDVNGIVNSDAKEEAGRLEPTTLHKRVIQSYATSG